MGKIKCAVITALLVAVIAVLAFFSLFSWNVPGSTKEEKFTSFISNIRLSSGMTGDAVAVLYPEGVISATEYTYGIPDEEDEKEEYTKKYVQYGSVYIEDGIFDDEEEFKKSVANDARIISKRLGEKGYTSYSVSVQDDYTIKVTVPTNFTYAAYKLYTQGYTGLRSTDELTNTIQRMTYNGELTLRNSEVGNSLANNILYPVKADVNEYFKSFSLYSAAGRYAVKINLTKAGREQFKTISNNIINNAESDQAIGFYVDENQLLSLSIDSEIDSSSFYIEADESYAEDYTIVLNSVLGGDVISLNYDSANISPVIVSAELGDYSAVYFAVALLIIIIGAVVYSIVRYKKLGLVNMLMIFAYSLAIIIALMLLEINFTIAGAVTAVLGLALLCGSNFAVFENIRKETKKGKTMQSAIKSGYKNMLTSILEMHIILLIVSLLLTLVGVGELAGCGLIFLIATVASYVLYWFTRFMWYVISSPVSNKFGFCGFTREELLDD